MKIVKLSSENVKRLSAVEIEPDGNVVVVGGKNGAGKTSVLDSICYALGGKGAIPQEPIRKGQESATIVVELDDLIVKRRFTEKGTTISVENTEGAKYGSPQAMLDKLVGKLSFDPLEFSRMSPTAQAQTLRELLGIDHSELDEERRKLYEQRTDINREGKRLKANLDSTAKHEDVPDAEVSVQALLEQRKELERHQREYDEWVEDVAAIKRRRELCVQDGKAAVQRVKDAEAELESAQKHLDACKDELVESEGKLKEATDSPVEPVDFTAIDDSLSTAEDTNRKVRENIRRLELAKEVRSKAGESEKLTDKIAGIDRQKQKMLSDAKFPIDGLGFNDDGVTFDGIPLEQSSSAELTKISTAVAIASNPELRITLIRDGSLLDDDSMAIITEMAAEHDVQFWIERVGSGDECSVIIEDGAVQELEAVEL